MKRWRGGKTSIPDARLNRRAAVLGLATAALSAPASAAAEIALKGRFQQGGFAIGRTDRGAKVFLDGQQVGPPSDDGYFFIGFDRDAGPRAEVRVKDRLAQASRTLDISKTPYDVQRIKGIRRVYEGEADAELEARIADETRRKAAAFASRIEGDSFRDGFSAPLRDFRVTARFGGQRIIDGRARPPHYGIDLAAPQGTPVYAPAGGTVVLADPRMLFEGGMIMIDHGQGLVSACLHLSAVDVSQSQKVRRGERIGAVGATGRATGPHLCWRLKWRGRNMNPMLLVGVPGPT